VHYQKGGELNNSILDEFEVDIFWLRAGYASQVKGFFLLDELVEGVR
jgi:hypothetical protein